VVWVEIAGDTKGLTMSHSLYGQNFRAVFAENDPASNLANFTVPMPEFRWWSLDEPWLYQIQLQRKRDGRLLDVGKRQFGMPLRFAPATKISPRLALH
jgi:hypothetical protein